MNLEEFFNCHTSICHAGNINQVPLQKGINNVHLLMGLRDHTRNPEQAGGGSQGGRETETDE